MDSATIGMAVSVLLPVAIFVFAITRAKRASGNRASKQKEA